VIILGRKKIDFNEVKKFVEDLGYELISAINNKSHWKLIIRDKLGYYYTPQLSNLKLGRIPEKFNTNNKFTLNNIKLWLKLNNLQYDLLSKKYEGSAKYLILRDYDGFLYTTTWDHLKKNHFPRKFDKNNLYTIYNIKLWCKSKDFELLSNIYKGSYNNLEWKCKKCGHTFIRNWQEIYRGQICNYCNCLAIKYPELCEEWDYIKNKDVTPYDISYGCETNYWWNCKKCNNSWSTSPNNRTYMKSSCPKCAETKGEKQLDIILTKYNIPHDSQYTFNDLRGIGNGLLRFDVPVFWDIEKTKLRLLIEYDGEFHYKKIYEDDGYETLQIHDQLKNEYCQKHNIKLLRIPYWDYDNIEQILCQELNLPYIQNNQLTKVS